MCSGVCGSIVAAILPADREEETGRRQGDIETDGDGSKRWHGAAADKVTLIDGVDSVLIDALQNASKRERNLTFKLEDNIVKFISRP